MSQPTRDEEAIRLARGARVEIRAELRGWEMGIDRVLTPSGVARCFEQMRWEMGRRARELRPGANLAELRGVVRAQTHDYLGELRYPGVWHGVTALVGVGRTSVTYGHELRDGGQELVARARTVIVLIGADGQPMGVPPTLAEALDPSVVAPEPLAPGSVGPSMPETPAHSLRARHSDQDMFGHVNQARYVDYLDDARRAAGLPALRRVTLGYERETFAGQDIDVFIGDADAAGVRAYEMRRANDGVVVNRGAIAT